MTAQDELDQAFAETGAQLKDVKARLTNVEADPSIGVLLVGDPNPTTPGFWFRETS